MDDNAEINQEETVEEPESLFLNTKLLTKEHFNYDKYVADRDREMYGLVDGEETTKDRVVALYFSASWCPPCQQFTPLLRQMVAELEERRAPLTVVFISFDKTKEDMEQYYLNHHGNWVAVRFEDPLKEKLSEKFNISAIPKLVVLRPDGEVITMRGRKDVQDKGMICFRNWVGATNITDTLSSTRTPRSEDRVNVSPK